MNIRSLSLGELLGLTLGGYLKMGTEEILRHGKCILCGHKPTQAGVCVADGSDEARKRIGTPDAATNPYSHRLIFWAVCDECNHDPARDQKVTARILSGVNQNGNAPTDSRPTPIADGQTFNL